MVFLNFVILIKKIKKSFGNKIITATFILPIFLKDLRIEKTKWFKVSEIFLLNWLTQYPKPKTVTAHEDHEQSAGS